MDHYHFAVGAFDCTLLKDTLGSRTAASFMTAVPPDELDSFVRQQGLDPTALLFATSPLLIRTADRLVLVDTGEGAVKGELLQRLREIGVGAGEIDTIVITHGHGDHVAGILAADGAFTFPNARYIFWRSEWEYWTAAERFAETPDHPMRRVWDALKAHPERIERIGGDQPEAEIMPGMCAVAAPGHTIGHIALELSSGGEKLLHIGDAAHSPFQINRPEWSPKFDYDKAQAAITRRALFERAAREGLLLCAYHFPFPGVGRVVESEGGLHWEQASG